MSSFCLPFWNESKNFEDEPMEEHILFLNMFSDYKPDDQTAKYFAQTRIVSADLDARQRKIYVTVFSPEYIPGQVLQTARSCLMRIYGLSDLKITAKHPETELSNMPGDDLMALFVAEKLAPMDQVMSTATHFVLRKYKEDGVLLSGKEDDERRVMMF